jgi:hypothetical protein
MSGSDAAKLPVELACIAALFVGTRALFLANGVSFDAGTLEFYWQVADTQLLENRLWETVTHLHSQAPLFNTYLGLVLKAFGDASPRAFQALSYAMSLAGICLVHASMQRLGISRRLRGVVTTLVVLNPSLVILENQLFYEIPTAFLVSLSMFLFLEYRRTGHGRYLHLLFATQATVSLLQSAFHLAWFVLASLIATGTTGTDLRTAARAIALPLALLAGWYAHAWVQFGSPSLGTAQVGFNLATVAAREVPDADRQRLVDEGALSGVTELGLMAFNSVNRYEGFYEPPAKTGIAILDRKKRSNGKKNTHHLAYIAISDVHAADAAVLMARFPGAYVRSVGTNARNLLDPFDQTWPFGEQHPNVQAIAGYHQAYRNLVYLQRTRDDPSLYYVLLFTVCVGWAGLQAARWYRRQTADLDSVLPYFLFNGVWGVVPLVLVSWDDQNRYRFRVECFLLCLLVLFLNHLGQELVRRRAND